MDMTAGFAADYDAPPMHEAPPDDDFSPFAQRDYDEPTRRNPLLAILIVLIVIAAAAAAFWFFAPAEWKHRLGLADGGTTPLTLVTTHMDRQKLASGNELLTVAGRVVNRPRRAIGPAHLCPAQDQDGPGDLFVDDRPAGADAGPGDERIIQQRRGQCTIGRGRTDNQPG